MIDVESFIKRQLEAWPMAKANFEALAGVKTRIVATDMGPDHVELRAQCNPARIRSTGAKMDAKSIRERACFLCAENRPAEQIGLPWKGYTILVNPYPIFSRHLTIPAIEHTPQRIAGRIADMIELSKELPEYTVFYNGPRCGASAPDHMHFQAAVFETAGIPVPYVEVKDAAEFERLVAKLPTVEGEEPMMNILARRGRIYVIPRKKHRPSFYGTEPGQMVLSPASVDLAGIFILPREEDYESITPEIARQAIEELCFSNEEIQKLYE